jgi:hypothetical protein
MRDLVVSVDPVGPRFPTDKPIDLGGVVIWATSIEYEDPDAVERLSRLPQYRVFWTPPNICALTWPG